MPTLATDLFDRANNVDLGASWTVVTGEAAFNIVSNHIVPSGVGSDCAEYYNAVTWPDNQWAQGKMTVVGTLAGGRGIGLVVRASSSARTYYRVVCDHGATLNVSLDKRITGTRTNLWTRTQAFTDGDTVRLEVEGTTLRVFFNSVQLGADTTDASIASGFAGVCHSSSTTSASIDDWTGGDFSAAAPGPITDLDAVAITSTRVDLTWTAATGATSHRVERATSS